MEDDQQFCLRWNNHQSTLISVFDTLLENGTLVDCTLAAEGKFLKAHKVVLSACSPYFATLLAQQYDKHPIFILKDVKYQELRAMMDYMYRGEVNISQDQLAALLKAAESLQIKGLSDNRGTATGAQHLQGAVPKQSTGKFSSAGLTIENKRTAAAAKLATESDVSVSREGSSSPSGRKRKKVRRRTVDQSTTVATETGSESLSNVTSNASSTAAANTTGSTVSSTNSAVAPNAVPSVSSAASPAALNITKKSDLSEPKKEQLEQVHRGSGAEDDEEDEDEEEEDDHHDMEPRAKRTTNRHDSNAGDELLEPKSEYDNDEPVEDLTLDDEELMEDLDQVGPSHGGEGSSHGYAWQVDRQDEVYMAGQEGSGQHRDSQDMIVDGIHINAETQFIRRRASNTTNSTSSTIARTKINTDTVNVVQRGASSDINMANSSVVPYSIVSGTPTNAVVAVNIQAPIHGQATQHAILTPGPQVTGQQQHSFQIYFSTANATTSNSSGKAEILQNQQIEWISSPQPLNKFIGTQSASGTGQPVPPLKKLHELPSSEPTTLEAPQAYPVIMNAIKNLQTPSDTQSICVLKSVGQQACDGNTDGTTSTSTLLSSLSPSVKIVKHMTTTKGSTISLPITLPINTSFGNTTTITLPMSTTITQKRVIAGNQSNSQTKSSQQQINIDNVRTYKFDDIELSGTGETSCDEDAIDVKQDGESTLAQKYSMIAATAVSSTELNENTTTEQKYAIDESGEGGGNSGPVSSRGPHSYACRHCGKRYRWKSTLRRHENDECGGKEPAHQCPYCSYKAKQRGNLGVHVRKHHGDLPQLESRRKKRSLEATLELAEELMSS